MIYIYIYIEREREWESIMNSMLHKIRHGMSRYVRCTVGCPRLRRCMCCLGGNVSAWSRHSCLRGPLHCHSANRQLVNWDPSGRSSWGPPGHCKGPLGDVVVWIPLFGSPFGGPWPKIPESYEQLPNHRHRNFKAFEECIQEHNLLFHYSEQYF